MTEVATIEHDVPAPVVSRNDYMMTMISNAVNGGADIQVIERLVALKERIDAQVAERAYSEALAAVKADLPVIVKNRVNTHTKSEYADLAAIDRAISPIISAHGFSLSFAPTRSDMPGHYGLICEVRHRDGHTVTHHADVPADTAGSQGKANKTAIQGFGSSMSYGRRYLTCMVFNIATGDDDGNEGAGDPLPEPLETRKRPSKSSLKKSGVWDDLQSDLEGVETVVALESLWREWHPKAIKDQWPDDWIEAMKDDFATTKKGVVDRLERELAG